MRGGGGRGIERHKDNQSEKRMKRGGWEGGGMQYMIVVGRITDLRTTNEAVVIFFKRRREGRRESDVCSFEDVLQGGDNNAD